jgi:hypothetical protein
MTQLNQSDRKINAAEHNFDADHASRSANIPIAGGFVGVLIFTTLLTLGSCSKEKSKSAAVTASGQSTASTIAPAPASAASAVPVTVPTLAPKRAKRRRPSTFFSYFNRPYGVSFSFPRPYHLKAGDEAQLSWSNLGQFQMDFVQPGGVRLAAVELPDNSYPGTDFKSGFVTVSVNPGMTSERCNQFAFPERTSAVESSAKVKIGAIEFQEVENSSATMMKQADAKYYHVFRNGACYEFALGIETEGDGDLEGITPVDREVVFHKLERILTTVKLQPTVVPPTQAPVPSAGVAGPAASPKTGEDGAGNWNF